MKSILSWVAMVFTILVSAPAIQGQVATGTYPYGTFDSLGIDTINVGNLNVHFALPVLNKAGRGLPFYYNMSYDSSIWAPSSSSGSLQWQPTLNWGWRGQTEISTGYESELGTTTVCSYDDEHIANEWIEVPNGWRVTKANVVYHDAWGVAHPFAGSAWTQTSTCGSLSGGTIGPLATDGSGYQWVSDGGAVGYIADRSGKAIAAPINVGSGAASVTDSNGNEISVNGSGQFTDTTGNVALTVAGTAPSPETFTYKDTSGNSQQVTMNYTNYTVRTHFNVSGILEYGPLSNPLVSSIVFPDGTTYSFSYEETPAADGCTPLSGTYSANCVTGRIASITTPQSGVISYTYSGGSNGIETDGSTAGLTRTMASNAGSAASTWSYTRTITGTGTSKTVVVDGLGNHKTYYFVEASNQPAGTTAAYYETQRSDLEGAGGTPILARNTCYNAAASPCTTTIPALPFAQIDTYETLNGLVTHGSTAFYNSYGMQTEAEIWDFASGTSSRGSLLRKEVWTYGYSIANLPTEDEVYDGTGDIIGNTLYTYDGTTPTASSGVPQHVAVTGPRGNLTGETVYASGSVPYALSATYEDTGSLLTSTTPNGTTTLSYDSSFVYNTGTSLPTPSSGVAIGTGESYDESYTGLPSTSTDPNSQVTHFTAYDALLRPLQINYPDGGITENLYNATQTSNYQYQNPSTYVDTETQFDGYGRLSRTAVSNGQATNIWYQQDTCYDGNGNLSFQSYRYQGAGFTHIAKACSGAGDAYSYDVLGRVTNLTRGSGETRSYSYSGRATEFVDENGVARISQVDGLGRPTIVCEISSNTYQDVSPTSCGTDISGTGFKTTYTYTPATGTTTITQGVQTRTFQSDWLGRPILVQEPERGKTTYSYVYNSTGLLVDRWRPEPNQPSSTTLTATSTQYDKLGRVVSIIYTNSSPGKTYAYDQSAGPDFTDLTQTNLIGRLSLASISGSTNLMTAYSYDAMGRVTALDSCFPSGLCGTVANNRQQHYTYDNVGNMLTSTDGAGVTSTYTWSRANELLSLTSSLSNATNPANIVSTVQNGPFGPSNYNLGNGLTWVNGRDGLGRISGGWICNGSTATYCTGGTQNYGFSNTWYGVQLRDQCDTIMGQCISFGYDEFNRLTSRTVTYGPAQNYTYGYDRYGNRWSQTPLDGGYTSSLSFTATTNQISTAGYAYDAAGNLTNDGFHTYTYDAEGNITAVDGGTTATYNYDALNHRGRSIVGSTVDEFLYNAAGQRASIWNGYTKAVVQGQYYWGSRPVAYYTGGSLHFQHQDWEGTERMRTTYNGGVDGQFTSLPFGDGLTTASGADTDAYHYAIIDHDYESDTDHAQFRQYSNALGRWMSPDPYGGSYKPRNPQSFNRYAYALNNPMSNVDPSGLCSQTVMNIYDEDGNLIDTSTSETEDGGTPCQSQTVYCNPGEGDFNLCFGGYSNYNGQAPNTGGGQSSTTSGGSGGAGVPSSPTAPNNAPKQNVFQCGAEAAGKISLAGGLSHIPGLKSGVGGFIANAVGGNIFSGATDLISSFGSGSGGGHSVFYNMGQGVVAGPTQGFGAFANGTNLGAAMEDTPWSADLVDAGLSALPVIGEYASGIGEAKAIYDGVTYVGAVGGCLAGIIK